uniref:protein FAR1-RELATED SEQUENCE 5-like n=1 Tax=Erigeron canadensis TaxID=72917 RepID=UPI001CB8E87D|nr:protein FAR1-RELATED SEQUENCE 5-like [Erigeron canadensis]
MELGYVLVIRRTNKNSVNVVNKITLICHHGGPRDKRLIGPSKRSNKIGCPFTLEGRPGCDGGWRVTVKDWRHNHDPTADLHGNAYARRMTEEEKEYVGKQSDGGLYPRQIQVMFSLLQEKNYFYQFTSNSKNGRLENLFFMHPTSMILWRAFPWVIEIDSTYKTNVYNMPLVEIVGVTSTSRTFNYAYVFIINEQEANYRWVLQSLKCTLVEGFAIRVVLTDRELALMRALKVVRPESKQLLCRFHIWQNINKHCEPTLRLKDVSIERLKVWWTGVYESRTVDHFNSNEKELKKKLKDFPSVYNYLKIIGCPRTESILFHVGSMNISTIRTTPQTEWSPSITC